MYLTFIDLVLVLVIFGFVFYGFFVGLIETLGSVVGMALGAYLAGQFYLPIGKWLAPLMWGNENFALIVSFIALFVIISRLVGLVFFIVNKIFHLISIIPFLKSINRIAGAIFGLIEGVLLVSICLFIVSKYSFAPLVDVFLANSQVAHGLLWVANIFMPLLPEVLKKVKAVV